MRISLLLQREPFGAILERTLSKFWSEKYGCEYTVRWYPGRYHSRFRDNSTSKFQPWVANMYLNVIVTPNAGQDVFDPIRREFSRSTSLWKRLPQRIYIKLASTYPGSTLLSHGYLLVSPNVPNADFMIIVAGNHKIRLLDNQAGIAYGILKDNFDPRFIQNELSARCHASTCGIPIPPLKQTNEDQHWFCEEYISGTPINRLPKKNEADTATKQIFTSLHKLLNRTRKKELLQNYLVYLQTRIHTRIDNNSLLTSTSKKCLLEQTSMLALRAMSTDPDKQRFIVTALTHGDLQPANILVNRQERWLIDWEYSDRRQISFDALVFGLSSRTQVGLAGRIDGFIQNGWPTRSIMCQVNWPGLLITNKNERYYHILIFLLEEMLVYLEENCQVLFTQIGSGFTQFQKEINIWLETKDYL